MMVSLPTSVRIWQTLRRFTSSGKLPTKAMAGSSSRNSSAVANMVSYSSECCGCSIISRRTKWSATLSIWNNSSNNGRPLLRTCFPAAILLLFDRCVSTCPLSNGAAVTAPP